MTLSNKPVQLISIQVAQTELAILRLESQVKKKKSCRNQPCEILTPNFKMKISYLNICAAKVNY